MFAFTIHGIDIADDGDTDVTFAFTIHGIDVAQQEVAAAAPAFVPQVIII